MRKETEMKSGKKIITENYCDECDEEIHALFDEDKFFAHKVGALKCPACGAIVMPCNECEDHDACGDCPWRGCKPVKGMSEMSYVKYIKAEEPKLFRMFLAGDCGEFYQKIAKKVNG